MSESKGKIVRFSSDINLAQQATRFGDTIGINAVYKTMATKASAYAQVSQDIDLLRLTLGGRVDYFDLIENKFAVAPRFSATYALTPVMNISASVGRYYQAPSYIWLVANPMNRNLSFVGTDQYIIGTDYMLQTDTKISLEGYVKQYFRLSGKYYSSISRLGKYRSRVWRNR